MFRNDDLPGPPQLTEWKKITGPHGGQQGAQMELVMWMEAARKVVNLGLTLRVTIRMRMPFRDYWTIRQLTDVLRSSKVTVGVDLDKDSWGQVPEYYRSLLMGMCKFSVTGKQLEKA
ncbi:hypothetical protein FBEOM_1175 [Fusarium beomiforme]|uniref:Uncharacterized protein n=1 Tax=Fusarium beomiforme TaxID=44412 RepID=A0A9P5AU98_9HYPO|nr:hypothetical protein FBEOM_1175 [Fusarium beomiforme]